MERDWLTFSAERCGDHLAVICAGHDMYGSDVSFEVEPSKLRRNLARQLSWSVRVEVCGEMLNAMIDQGIALNDAWTIVAALLPTAISDDTAWADDLPLGEQPTQNGDQRFQRHDQFPGQAVDGDERPVRRMGPAVGK